MPFSSGESREVYAGARLGGSRPRRSGLQSRPTDYGTRIGYPPVSRRRDLVLRVRDNANFSTNKYADSRGRPPCGSVDGGLRD
jgi:hypothetical protein